MITVAEIYKNSFGFYVLEPRLTTELEKLDDDELISFRELSTILKIEYSKLYRAIHINRRHCKRGLYEVLLDKYIIKKKIKCANKLFIKKSGVSHFREYFEWFENYRKVIKEKQEYKKAIQKYYGNPSQTTEYCIKANYDCAKCINAEICEIYKTQISQKKLAKTINAVFGANNNIAIDNLYESRSYYEHEINKLKEQIKAIDREKEQYLNCYKATKKELYEVKETLVVYKKAFSKIHKDAVHILELQAQGYKLSEIAKMCDCSESNIRQVRAKFLRQIQKFKKISKRES